MRPSAVFGFIFVAAAAVLPRTRSCAFLMVIILHLDDILVLQKLNSGIDLSTSVHSCLTPIAFRGHLRRSR